MHDDSGSEPNVQERGLPSYLAPTIKSNALKIAARWKPVFPVRPNKKPYTRNGFKDATTDPARINTWWDKHPDALIGMPTGAASGVFAVDVDRLEALDELPHELPETLTVRTRRGGRHFYFQHVEGIRNSPGGLPEGMDVRGEGGYVIVPPSEGYSWEDRSPVADAPEWLLELIRSKPVRPGPNGTTKHTMTNSATRSHYLNLDSIEPIPDGCRNMTLARIAGRLHDGRPREAFEAALLEVNARRCEPPLPEAEVLKTAASIFPRDPCRPGRGKPGADILDALERFDGALRSYPWARWKSGMSATKYLLTRAREFGRLLPNGWVKFNLTQNELALGAAISPKTAERYTKRIKQTGLVGQDNANRKPKEASTWLLKPPVRDDGTRLQGEDKPPVGVCTVTSRTLPLTRPRLRASERFIRRLGKSWEALRDELEAASGKLSFEDARVALNLKSARDLKRPRPDGWLQRAIDAGLVHLTTWGIFLADGWEAREDRSRERTGEIAAYTRDAERYKRLRKDWLDRLNMSPEDARAQKKRPASEAELNARRDLEVLRGAGAERKRYRRQFKQHAQEQARARREERQHPLTQRSFRVLCNERSAPGMIAECYRQGETKTFGIVTRAVAQFYGDEDNWKAWDKPVREAYALWKESLAEREAS